MGSSGSQTAPRRGRCWGRSWRGPRPAERTILVWSPGDACQSGIAPLSGDELEEPVAVPRDGDRAGGGVDGDGVRLADGREAGDGGEAGDADPRQPVARGLRHIEVAP